MLTPGSTLGGRYQLTERIASGGMGDVWKAEDSVLGRTVAVKVLLPTLLEEPGFVTRFHGEARIMATINHPGVVDVYDFGESELAGGGRVTYLVMEYVRGEPLSQVLANTGRLTPQRALDLVAQAAYALQAAHDKGIIHRDVKPGNLLVRPDGTLVLTDFGIARSGVTANLTAVGSTLGTAGYMSPEQAAGEPAGPLSDVYSLGVVAYQCVAGRQPFEGENALAVAVMHIRDTPPPLPGDVPPGVRLFIERAMAKDAAARWPSATAMAHAARSAVSGGSGPARTAPFPHRAVPLRGSAAAPTPVPPRSVGMREAPAYAPDKPTKGKGLLVAGIASAMMLVLVVFGIAYAMSVKGSGGGKGQLVGDDPTGTPPASTVPTMAPAMVAIDCAWMVGKPFKNIEDKLRKLELNINMVPVESDADEGRVVDIPCEAPAGSHVSVKVSKGKSAPPAHTPPTWLTPTQPPSPSVSPTGTKPTARSNLDYQETTP